MRITGLFVLLTTMTLWVAGCTPSSNNNSSASGSQDKKKPTVAYVTNGIASFWTIAEVGAKKAGDDFDVEVLVRMPPNGTDDQRRMMEELLTMKVDGIAVSPIDPANQQDILNSAAERTKLITHDSDAPDTKRLAYIGMSNYEAGRMCGELVKEAMPEGGTVMIFVGRIEQLNARLRRQGLIDELMDRSYNPDRFDKPGQKIIGDKYTILGTKTDNFVFDAAKSQAEDALTANPDLGCMVGLFAYNPPYILEALKSADRLGKVKLVGFDEHDATLQAIKDGHCYGTVVQDPYRYGYESVKLLASLARDSSAALPENEFMNIPARKITANNVEAFWTELKRLVAGGEQASSESQQESDEAKTGAPKPKCP